MSGFKFIIPVVIVSFIFMTMACGDSEVLEIRDIDLGAMMKLADENIVAANNQYKGSNVRFEGLITDIDKGSIQIVPDEITNLVKLSGAKCSYRNDEEKIVVKLRPNQKVVVTGKVKSISESILKIETVHVADCRILEY